jgi:hypothetical protein
MAFRLQITLGPWSPFGGYRIMGDKTQGRLKMLDVGSSCATQKTRITSHDIPDG